MAIVEKAPHKFNLTPAEVSNRRSFIAQVKHRLASLKQESESKGAQANTAKKSSAEKQVCTYFNVSDSFM